MLGPNEGNAPGAVAALAGLPVPSGSSAANSPASNEAASSRRGEIGTSERMAKAPSGRGR